MPGKTACISVGPRAAVLRCTSDLSGTIALLSHSKHALASEWTGGVNVTFAFRYQEAAGCLLECQCSLEQSCN